MGLTGIPLKPSTAIAFSLTLTIADDDTIQFLARVRRQLAAAVARGAADAHEAAAIATLRETSLPMFVTACAESVGFLPLALSQFVGLVRRARPAGARPRPRPHGRPPGDDAHDGSQRGVERAGIGLAEHLLVRRRDRRVGAFGDRQLRGARARDGESGEPGRGGVLERAVATPSREDHRERALRRSAQGASARDGEELEDGEGGDRRSLHHEP